MMLPLLSMVGITDAPELGPGSPEDTGGADEMGTGAEASGSVCIAAAREPPMPRSFTMYATVSANGKLVAIVVVSAEARPAL